MRTDCKSDESEKEGRSIRWRSGSNGTGRVGRRSYTSAINTQKLKTGELCDREVGRNITSPALLRWA